MNKRAILSRVKRLERDSAHRDCAVCGGAGRIVAVRVHESGDEPEPTGCPGCGELTVIRVSRSAQVSKSLSFRAQARYC